MPLAVYRGLGGTVIVVGIVGLVVGEFTGITDKVGEVTLGFGGGLDTVFWGGSSGEGVLDSEGDGFLIFSQGGHSHWISMFDSSSWTICL